MKILVYALLFALSLSIAIYTFPTEQPGANYIEKHTVSSSNRSEFITPKISYRRKPARLCSNSNYGREQQVYIAVIDSTYRSSELQCAIEKTWISKLRESKYVDDIEFFSNASWINRDCNIAPNVVPMGFHHRVNPSTLLLWAAFNSFLTRSDAKFLFVVSDHAYVNTDAFRTMITDDFGHDNYVSARGMCKEDADYYQVFALDSGFVVSRSLARSLVNQGKIWEILMEMDSYIDDAVTYLLYSAGVEVYSSNSLNFLGLPFDEQDMLRIQHRDYTQLIKCPMNFNSKRVCDTSYRVLSDTAVVASPANRTAQFIYQMSDLFNPVPDNLGYYIDKYTAVLCRL